MHFGQIPRVPGDPILGLMDLYRADPNPAKLDLGVGVYKDAQGLTPIPRAVKLAEQRLVDSEQTKSYIGGHGDAQFGGPSFEGFGPGTGLVVPRDNRCSTLRDQADGRNTITASLISLAPVGFATIVEITSSTCSYGSMARAKKTELRSVRPLLPASFLSRVRVGKRRGGAADRH